MSQIVGLSDGRFDRMVQGDGADLEAQAGLVIPVHIAAADGDSALETAVGCEQGKRLVASTWLLNRPATEER